MSIPTPPYPKPDAVERLAELAAAERLVEFDAIERGDVVHTGFGNGPEYWLITEGQDPFAAVIDMSGSVVVGARLIVDAGRPINDLDRIASRGVRITSRVPRV